MAPPSPPRRLLLAGAPLSIGDLRPIMWLRAHRGAFQDVAKSTGANIDDVVGACEDAGHPKDVTAAADVEQATTAKKPTRKAQGFLFDGADDYLAQKVYDDETGASWGPANHGVSLIAASAFLRVQAVDLSPFAGVEGTATPYIVVLTDQASKVAWGYLGAADVAQALGGDKTITGITKANPGIVTFQAGHGFTGGELIKWKSLTQMTELNAKYCTLANKAGDTFEIVDTSAYAAAETTGGACANQVTDAGADAVHIVSTPHGSTRNWAAIDAGFAYNDSAYTVQVLKSVLNGPCSAGLTVGCWIKTAAEGNDIFAKYTIAADVSENNAWAIFMDSGNLYFRIASGDTQYNALKTGAFNNGNWQLLIGVFIPSTSITLYRQGSQVAQNTTSIPATLNDISALLTLGYVGGNYLTGTINDAFALDYALDPNSIQHLYQSMKERYT